MKTILQIILCSLAFPLYSTPATINDPSDYQVLDRFFRKMVQDEAFGYVLEGKKPLSALNIYPNTCLRLPHSCFFQWNVLAEEAIKKWKQLAPMQKNTVFKITKVFDRKFGGFYHELLFINRDKLKDTLEDNLDLFRILLGPTLDTTSLTELIADSPQPLDTIIKSNNALMGILLGYGTHNSLMGGRLEEIEGAQGTFDSPPFSDALSQKAREEVDWGLQNYFLSYIASANYSMLEKYVVQPGSGCITLQEERKKITAQKEEVPVILLKEKPAFIFGAYKNPHNKCLFEEAQISQKSIQTLLSKSDLLEYILEKITGEKPIVSQAATLKQTTHLAVNGDVEEAVANIVGQWLQEFDKEVMSKFVEAFVRCEATDNLKPKVRISSGVLAGLKLARSNLQIADEQILSYSKTEKLIEIVPQGLYFEDLKIGSGKHLDSVSDILLSYVIEDGLGNTLSARHNCWIDLSQTIPAFTNGMKGMQEEGVRKIYIHPKYGYGALTTLSPCTILIAKVTLHKISDETKGFLPPLTPITLDWINDPKFFEEVREASLQDAAYLGYLWGTWLSKSSDMHFEKLCDQLIRLSANQEFKPPSNEMLQLSNRVFWNLITEDCPK